MKQRLDEILSAINLVAHASGVDLPDEQIIMVGTPVVTCESVVIAITNRTAAPGFDQGPRCNRVWQATFVVLIAREHPGFVSRSGATIVDGINEVSEQATKDSDVLLAALDHLSLGLVAVSNESLTYDLAGDGKFYITQLDFNGGI